MSEIEELRDVLDEAIKRNEGLDAEIDRLKAALKTAREAGIEVAIDAVILTGLVDGVKPGSGWQQRIRDYCAAMEPKP